jgi:hypothetical protein
MRNMSTLTRIAAVWLGLTCLQASTAKALDLHDAVIPSRHMTLFNGKDLAGWTWFPQTNSAAAETWSFTNGLIRCTGKPMGYLRTVSYYRDYRLTVEWRFVKVAPGADNTGVLVHMRPPDKLWPPCVQCQGKFDHQGDLFLMGGAESREHRGMDMNTPLPKRGPSAEKPAGEWNTCEMICSNNSVKAFINGRLMNEVTDCTVTSGAVGIQSEGGELEIRAVVLDPLK